ncbi:hypothetical protein TeGR_g12790 [Tetraparma gracilis]|uniref:Uncharacterized protein n=1 Tax=Tetraparma gracilis TaxID=2962635 RepID=A0ABQ6ND33_9STRA|nr:hypothetical protein TeGR_g12790 [Tetraparma gracilis]
MAPFSKTSQPRGGQPKQSDVGTNKQKRSRDKESSKESKRAKSASPVAAPAPKPEPKPAAEYPATKMPPAALVKSVYEAHGSKGKVTIDDAIVSICKNENEELKRLQGRLQREGSEEDIDAVMRARVAVKDIEARAIEALGVAHAERAALVEAAKQNNPQNRALWEEVKDLNEALQILRQEEKAWGFQLVAIEERERLLADGRIEQDEVDTLPAESEIHEPRIAAEITTSILPAVDLKIKESVEDITLAADRIAHVLRGVNALVEKTDTVKKELFDTYYTDGEMFKEYVGVDNPKGLIKRLLGWRR